MPAPRRRRARDAPPETIEPGGEVGESRDMGPGGSAADLPGRAPRTRVVVHEPRRGRPPGGEDEG